MKSSNMHQVTMKIRLKDIAEQAGVSVNTVSRALKNKPDIGVKTRQRIQKMANELGYTPNAIARSLVLQRSNMIGLAVSEIDNPVRSHLIELLRRNLKKYGLKLLVTGLDSQEATGQELNELFEHGVDGIIFGSVSGKLEATPMWRNLEKLIKRGFPVAGFGNFNTDKIDHVQLDYKKHAEELTNTLIKRGFKRIAFWDIELVQDENNRQSGYLSAMRQAGLSPEVRQCETAGTEGGRLSIKKYLDTAPVLPEVIIGRNDQLAIGIMSGLHQAGFNIPGDIAVAGFDNIELCDFLIPSLTSVGVDANNLADNLAEIIKARLNDKSRPVIHRTLPCSLVERESTIIKKAARS
jgi:LacI family transcriptional regulator